MPVSAVAGLVHVELSACTDRRVSCGRPLTLGPDQAAQGVAPARPGPWLPYRPTGKRLGRPLLLQSGAAVPVRTNPARIRILRPPPDDDP